MELPENVKETYARFKKAEEVLQKATDSYNEAKKVFLEAKWIFEEDDKEKAKVDGRTKVLDPRQRAHKLTKKQIMQIIAEVETEKD